MKIHFSQNLKLNDSQKHVVSDLVSQRVSLLIGATKASCIENIFFCDLLPKNELLMNDSSINHNLSHHVSLYINCGKANLYCSAQLLYGLMHQTVEMPSFDDAIIAISRELPVPFLS